MSLTFDQLITRLHNQERRKRIAVVCPNDGHTLHVIQRSLEEGIADFALVVEEAHREASEEIQRQYPDRVTLFSAEDTIDAARLAVSLVHKGKADVLMKGTLNTDVLLRAVLNKEEGLLPPGSVLSHVTVAQLPTYHKLLLFSDAAVVPRPRVSHFEAMLRYDLKVCNRLGIDEPQVALIHCTEKINGKFPHTLGYVILKERARKGQYGSLQIDGPMDAKTACDPHSAVVKGIESSVVGNADLLIFPNIESSNTFYKAISLFGQAHMAGMLTGTTAPVVLPSRADSDDSKYYSLVLACTMAE
ncbi:MAG: phosphate butyryltransferase [Bacteroidaceae bacterium]|nr:phosphate butyryltransferase [Bacteroidaceae bacterium]